MANQGPLYPGTIATEYYVGAVGDWATPNNAKVEDGTETSAYNHWNVTGLYKIKATGFSFAIPSSAVIDRITVEYKRRASQNVTTGGSEHYIALADIYPVKVGSTPEGWAIESPLPLSLAWVSFANSTNAGHEDDPLWAMSWTPANVNDTGFGVAAVLVVHTHDNATDVTAYVDAFRITVDYTLSGYQHKVLGVPAANIGKIMGIPTANIAKFNGV